MDQMDNNMSGINQADVGPLILGTAATNALSNAHQAGKAGEGGMALGSLAGTAIGGIGSAALGGGPMIIAADMALGGAVGGMLGDLFS